MDAQVPEVPENLESLSTEELQALADALLAAGRENQAADSPESQEALTAAADRYSSVQAEFDRRDAAEAAAAEQKASALAKLGLDTPEPEAPAPVETATVDGPAPEAPAALEVVTPEQLAAAAGGVAIDGPREPVRVPAKARFSRPQRTRARRDIEPAAFFNSGAVDAGQHGQRLDKTKLAALIARQHDTFRSRDIRGIAPMTLASAAWDADEVRLSASDSLRNMRILQEASNAFASEQRAVVASGGNCAIATPRYEVFNAAEEQAPVEEFLPTEMAPRGAIRYLPGPNWAAAQAGVTVTTEAESEADTVDKTCVAFACPTETTCNVDAVSACAQFDNLNYKAATELVEVLLDQLAVAATQAKEIAYLDAIEAGSTMTWGNPHPFPYGIFRTIKNQIGALAWGYRKRNHISHTTPLDLLVPDTIIPNLAADFAADHALGAEYALMDQDTLADEIFRTMNLNVGFYYDYSSDWGAANAMEGPQAEGSLNELQVDFRAYIFAPGTWVRLDGGTLDVGIVRDSTLNNTNDLQIFSEEWVQACRVGYESVALNLSLCPTGAGPEATETNLACQS